MSINLKVLLIRLQCSDEHSRNLRSVVANLGNRPPRRGNSPIDRNFRMLTHNGPHKHNVLLRKPLVMFFRYATCSFILFTLFHLFISFTPNIPLNSLWLDNGIAMGQFANYGKLQPLIGLSNLFT